MNEPSELAKQCANDIDAQIGTYMTSTARYETAKIIQKYLDKPDALALGPFKVGDDPQLLVKDCIFSH